jgi:hypothetical protein
LAADACLNTLIENEGADHQTQANKTRLRIIFITH